MRQERKEKISNAVFLLDKRRFWPDVRKNKGLTPFLLQTGERGTLVLPGCRFCPCNLSNSIIY